MLAKPKQIVIDKESLISANIDKLRVLARSHSLLACDTLLYECATTSESVRKDILHRYKRIVEAGAYYCSCSIGCVQYESNYCHPYPWFLPDLEATEYIRSKRSRVEDLLDPTTTEQILKSRRQVARDIFLELSKKLKITLDLNNPEVGKEIRKLPSDAFARFQKLFERIDLTDIHQMGVNSVPKDWIKDETKFCLSPEWISWQFMRLTNVVVQNYYYLRQMGGPPGENRAEHDYQDIEYILLLSRADGILTNDQSLIKPLAKAAFPDKQVFSSIEEIPSN